MLVLANNERLILIPVEGVPAIRALDILNKVELHAFKYYNLQNRITDEYITYQSMFVPFYDEMHFISTDF